MRVINFYKFIELDELMVLKAQLLNFGRPLGVKGFVLLAPEGINVSLSGEEAALQRFIEWIRADARFADIVPKWSSSRRRAFKKFYVKIKPWIIRFIDELALRPDEINGAPRMSPEELRAILRDRPRDVVLVDTRNKYETEYGTFRDAELLPIQSFTEFAQRFEQDYADQRHKRFVFFCTGGVRCEKVVPWAQSRGFNGATQLEGGILGYFERCGDEGYDGTCFVFDKRWLVNGRLEEADDSSLAMKSQPKPLE